MNTTTTNTAAMRRTSRTRLAGFTLIELLVTLAIGVVLMVVAVPSFVQFRKNADLSDAVSSFIMASGAAKSAALKSGQNTFMAVNDTAIGWKSGWIVFQDTNWNNTYEEGTDTVVFQREALASDIVVTTPPTTTAASGYLVFTGSGFPGQKLSATTVGGMGNGVVVMANTQRSSSIVVDTSGRVRSCKTGESGCSLF
jgi:type IV fimbrial biogenesis protein FimT